MTKQDKTYSGEMGDLARLTASLAANAARTESASPTRGQLAEHGLSQSLQIIHRPRPIKARSDQSPFGDVTASGPATASSGSRSRASTP
jgi:hypothetical protein